MSESRYPWIATPSDDYVRPAVKIESGGKSALDPNSPRVIRPYVEADAAGLDLSIAGVTVEPERTLWDKVVILHGLRRWYETRGELRGGRAPDFDAVLASIVYLEARLNGD